MPNTAYDAGALDARRRFRLGLWLLQLAPVSDRELSDYWYGFHQTNAAKKRRRKVRKGKRRK